MCVSYLARYVYHLRWLVEPHTGFAGDHPGFTRFKLRTARLGIAYRNIETIRIRLTELRSPVESWLFHVDSHPETRKDYATNRSDTYACKQAHTKEQAIPSFRISVCYLYSATCGESISAICQGMMKCRPCQFLLNTEAGTSAALDGSFRTNPYLSLLMATSTYGGLLSRPPAWPPTRILWDHVSRMQIICIVL